MTPSQPTKSDTALDALEDLARNMYAVFDNDWAFTRDMLNADPSPYTIAPDRTFLDPGVEDEANNWGNRGSLLAAYRRAVMVLKAHGRDPDRIP
jgi:hypothetical protein